MEKISIICFMLAIVAAIVIHPIVTIVMFAISYTLLWVAIKRVRNEANAAFYDLFIIQEKFGITDEILEEAREEFEE